VEDYASAIVRMVRDPEANMTPAEAQQRHYYIAAAHFCRQANLMLTYVRTALQEADSHPARLSSEQFAECVKSLKQALSLPLVSPAPSVSRALRTSLMTDC
jgi:hypothetical protein